MAIRDFKPAWTEKGSRYMLEFWDHPDGGYAFDCDKDGNVDESKLEGPALRNYHFAMSNPDKFPYCWKYVEEYRADVRHPASGKCHCGKRIELRNDYLGACECPRCHRWWNVYGEELNDPRTWRNGGDW